MVNLKRTYISDPTNAFAPCDVDDSSATKYYGFERPDGAWYIQKESSSGGVTLFRYAAGSSNYSSNFTDRVNLTYDYPSEILV